MPSLPTNINATPRQVHVLPMHNTNAEESDLTISTVTSALGKMAGPPGFHSSPQRKVSFRPHLTLETGVGDARLCRDDQSRTLCQPKSPKSETQKRKKASGVLKFLAIKEPSTSAWEDYAEQQRKQSAHRGGRPTPVGMPGVSTQKLPSHVPKVNSKWDGLPESAQAKGAQRRDATDSRRSFTLLSLPRSSRVSSESDSTRTPTSIKNYHASTRPSTSHQPASSSAQDRTAVPARSPRGSHYTTSTQVNQVNSTTLDLQPDVHVAKSRTTFLLPPSPMSSPSQSHDLLDMGSFFLDSSPNSAYFTTSPKSASHTSSRNDTSNNTTILSRKDIEYLLPNDDEVLTSWMDDSDDATVKISFDPSKREAQILNNSPFALSSYLDMSNIEEDTPRMLGHQTRTPSASSVGSTCTADSTSSNNSSIQPSLFSNDRSILTRPSTNASSETLPACPQPHSASDLQLPYRSSAKASPVSVSTKQCRSLRDRVKKSEVLPWEMYEPSDR